MPGAAKAHLSGLKLSVIDEIRAKIKILLVCMGCVSGWSGRPIGLWLYTQQWLCVNVESV